MTGRSSGPNRWRGGPREANPEDPSSRVGWTAAIDLYKLWAMRSLAPILVLVLMGCAAEPVAPALTGPVLPTAQVDSFAVYHLQRYEMWDWSSALQGVTPYSVDATGLPVDTIDGVLYHHPIHIVHIALATLSNSQVHGDTALLHLVERWTSQMVQEADTDGATISFPYRFGFDLHGYASEHMSAPWYSGMAQGQWLELLVRLYQITGDARYRVWADKVFHTFTDVRPSTQNPRTVAHIDSDGYYWVDEYPNRGRYDLTFNGFMFALRGLYEYDQLVHTANTRRILLAGLTTIKRYAPSFRVIGGISYYCLRHKVQSAKYHTIHILQLHDLYKVTRDPSFEDMANAFKADYWAP